jgi:hypothetical protein
MLLISTAALVIAISPAVPAPTPAVVEATAWGEPGGGLRLGLRRAGTDALGQPRLVAVLENVGRDDLVLNLGLMLGNGKRQMPTAIRLILTGADGKKYMLTRKVGAVAGRVDPLVVPLPIGCRYEVLCELAQFAPPDTVEVPMPVGKGVVVAEFVGEAVIAPNPDLTGLALMSYWKGTVRSGTVRTGFPVKRE